jgi:Uma2 family endonuclease
MTATAERLITAEEFFVHFGDRDEPVELVEGVVVELSPTNPEHGDVDSSLNIDLGGFVRERGLGRVFLNTGFILARDPDVVRGPDQAFVSAERLAANPRPSSGFWEIAPDLAVEIISPNDTADEVTGKVDDFLAAGVRSVWLVYPKRRQVQVVKPGDGTRSLRVFSGNDLLEDEEILPGFRLPLERIWS